MRILLAALLLLATSVHAAPPTPAELPAALRDWTDWVLHDADHASCPLRVGAPADDPASRACLWPGRLAINVERGGARFALDWRSLAPRALPLPGDAESWPQAVSVDGRPAAVVADARGLPVVWLPPGDWRIEGRFAWEQQPEQLMVPAIIGWVDLVVDGTAVVPPRRAGERLWLGRGSDAGTGTDSLAIEVYRRLADGVPMQLDTHIALTVAGRGREEILGRPLPEGFEPISVAGALPARLDAAGRLVVQVRPGMHEVVVVARATRPDPDLRTGGGDAWPAQEVWSWAADTRLRVVETGGAPGIDPAQTSMPREWTGLPAFVLDAESTLALTAVSRGLSEQERNRLSLSRQLWLDFDGDGWVARDRVDGSLVRDWRLDVAAPYVLTRAEAGDGGLLVTRGVADGLTGVELRESALALAASSEIDAGSVLPVTGWQQDFDTVDVDLNLPPGWRLIAAPGADVAVGSWAARWDLLDVFLVAVTALLAWWLARWPLALLVGAYCVLAWHEPGAPRFSLMLVLGLALLARLLPAGRLGTVMTWARIGAVAILLFVTLPFAADQARLALYPQLERSGVDGYDYNAAARAAETAAYEQQAMVADMPAPPPAPPAPAAPYESSRLQELNVSGSRMAKAAALQRYAPNTQVQAGAGLPAWNWSSYRLTWSGPVLPSQQVRLVMSPPWLTRGLRVAVLILLGVALGLLARAAWRGRGGGSGGRAAALAAAGMLLAPLAGAQDLPGPEQLDALRARLLEAPACAPACAGIAAATVETSATRWRVALDVHAASAVAVPLPSQPALLAPISIAVDGVARDGLLAADGATWIDLAPGVHRVTMEFMVADADQVDLRFPLPPRRIEVGGADWRAAGIASGRLLTDTLAMTRVRADGAAAGSAAQQFAPYVRVTRTLLLDLDWRIETVVERIAPANGAFTVAIPLVAGERVASAGIEVDAGEATIALQADEASAGWQSRIDTAPTLAITAPGLDRHAEVWRVAASPTWNVRAEGVPVVKSADGDDAVLEFHPLPGETLTLTVARPEAVAGPTVAIDRAELSTRVGRRAREHTLTLSLRATQGGTHPITLPDAAEILGVEVDGRTVNVRPEQGRLGLPVTPGAQQVVVRLRETDEVGAHVDTPAIGLGTAASNLHVQLEIPADRWVLATFGPAVGPAVLYWSALVVLLAVAVGLSRSRRTPLKLHDWLLLALGFSTFSWLALMVVAGWLFALDARARRAPADPTWFNLVQLALAALTTVALLALVAAIPQGLLGEPDMQVQGNGSSGQSLRWFADRTTDAVPVATAISVSLWWYKAAMLAWALWLATALMRWLRWGWQAWSAGGYWRQMPARPGKRAGAPAPAAAAGASPAPAPATDTAQDADDAPR